MRLGKVKAMLRVWWLLAALTAVLLLTACKQQVLPEFTAQPASGRAPLAVQFTDQSTWSGAPWVLSAGPTSWQWDFGDGQTSQEQNPSHSYTRAGTYEVTFTATNEAGPATSPKKIQIQVSPGLVSRVEVAPARVSLSIGQQQPFTVTAYDQYDNEIEIAQLSLHWQAEAGGTIESNGVFTAGNAAGSFTQAVTVKATEAGAEASATSSVTVKPDPLVRVELQPAQVRLNIGEEQEFTVKAYDQYDNEIAGLPFQWQAKAGGSIDPKGMFTAGTTAGSFTQAVTVKATEAGAEASAGATVSVNPDPLERAEVSPATVTLPPKDSRQLSASTFDQYGNRLRGLQLAWSVEAGGKIDEAGEFTAGEKAGDYPQAIKVVAQQGAVSRSATASLTVVPGPLHHIVLSPATAELAIGKSQAFTATCFDAYDNPIPGLSFQWQVTGEVGKVDDQGRFTSGTRAGTFATAVQASATQGEVTKTGSASVTVKPDPLSQVVVEPAGVTLKVGTTQQFTATGQDQYGNVVPGVAYSYEVTQGGGSIDQNGLFTAATLPGEYGDTIQVTASLGGLSATAKASVTLKPGPLESIVVSPHPGDIGMGMTQQFIAAGLDQYGNQLEGLSFTWSLAQDKGSITEAGLLTAPGEPGTYEELVQATATAAGVTKTGAATLIVEPDRIAFVSDRDGNPAIYVMDADGGNVKRISPFYDMMYDLDWSPDGSQIVYDALDLAGMYIAIYVISAEGGEPTRLTDASWEAVNYLPAWSPDGAKIAFASQRGENIDIYVMDADGSHQQRLTTHQNIDGFPAWSPDGGRIAFTSVRTGNGDIYVMKADGSELRRLTTNPANDGITAWSPDGKKIAFQSDRDGDFEIFVMDADGANQVQLTRNAAWEGNVEWSYDGSQIVFNSTRDVEDRNEIYVMNADGSGVVRLTTNSSEDISARWAPRKQGVAPPPIGTATGEQTATAATTEEVIARAKLATVRIVTATGYGSGFIIDSTGYVLTNNHVVADVTTAQVKLSDGRSYNGIVLGRDLVRDMAILKIPGTDLTALTLGEASGLAAGQEVIAIGYPGELEGEATVTTGIVSALRQDRDTGATWVQTDVAINPGNSGGPLLNLQGQVIGITTFKKVTIGGIPAEGIGFALSVETIKAQLSRLKAGAVITS